MGVRWIHRLSGHVEMTLEFHHLTCDVGVRLRAVLHRRGDEIHLRHQLLLIGVDARHVPVHQIEAGAKLVKGCLHARDDVAHGVEDELRLRRWFCWRRGEILARSGQTSSQRNRIGEKLEEISPQIRPLTGIL
jgi:hypothetical protein